MKRILLIFAASLSCLVMIYGQDNEAVSLSASEVECAPGYFGPNALPIIDMHNGRVTDKLEVSLSGDYFAGFDKNTTYNPYISLVVPLYPKRVSVSLWVVPVEFYRSSLTGNRFGHAFGDFYLSTDIQILRDKRYAPDILLRIGLKTASGGKYEEFRYFDSPGYFFDTSIGKSFYLPNLFFSEWRAVLSAGFLCWQIADATQNDAYMYGVKIETRSRYLDLSFDWGGYTGWRKDRDAPMSIKAKATGKIKDWDVFFQYQYGIRDYDFHEYRIGFTYHWDFWKLISEKKMKKEKR